MEHFFGSLQSVLPVRNLEKKIGIGVSLHRINVKYQGSTFYDN
jgi:hypothetical protein